MYDYKATVVKIVDGDTIDVDIDLGFYMVTRQRLRINRIDTPEREEVSRNEEQANQFVAIENLGPDVEGVVSIVGE